MTCDAFVHMVYAHGEQLAGTAEVATWSNPQKRSRILQM